jgi:hypothetical protein
VTNRDIPPASLNSYTLNKSSNGALNGFIVEQKITKTTRLPDRNGQLLVSELPGYGGIEIQAHYRIDMLMASCIKVENNSIKTMPPSTNRSCLRT